MVLGIRDLGWCQPAGRGVGQLAEGPRHLRAGIGWAVFCCGRPWGFRGPRAGGGPGFGGLGPGLPGCQALGP